MIFLWILLGIIGLLALLVSIPVSLRVRYDGSDPLVELKYLFISYTIYPAEREKPEPGKVRAYIDGVLAKLKEKQKERRKKKAENAPQKPQEPKKSGWQSLREQRGFWGAVKYLLRIVAESADLGAYVLRHSVISRCRLHIAIGGDDAAQIGISQGRWCAAVYPAVSLVLCSVRRYRNCSLNIYPDFLSTENKYDIDIRLQAKPFHGAAGALRMLISLAKAETTADKALYSLDAMKAASERVIIHPGSNHNKQENTRYDR